MTLAEHESYAQELLSSLSDDNPDSERLDFSPDPARSRNTAKAMTAILCQRLFRRSNHQPVRKRNTTYEWKEGVFNCRNIADRDYLWSNLRRDVADAIHDLAIGKPVAYLLAFSNPASTTLSVWAIPEPLLHDSLPSLPEKKGGREYTLQIFADKQRIDHYGASPDLARYFREFPLSGEELRALKESREVDALVRRELARARKEEAADTDEGGGNPAGESETNKLLAAVARQLTEAGVFDPSGISDAREHVLSSIVRRRGRPAFRRRLLAAYKGHCAITGCGLEPVLEAVHIIPYRGPKTNHPANGLLLRTDLHTLFDLKLIAIDAATMSLLVSTSLTGSCYEEYRGRLITVPDDPSSRPSQEALEQHRQESGL